MTRHVNDVILANAKHSPSLSVSLGTYGKITHPRLILSCYTNFFDKSSDRYDPVNCAISSLWSYMVSKKPMKKLGKRASN